MDLFSEFLTVEKGGKLLYRAALGLVRDPDVKRQVQKFYEQTARHEEVLTVVIGQFGGNPQHTREGPRLAEKKARALPGNHEPNRRLETRASRGQRYGEHSAGRN